MVERMLYAESCRFLQSQGLLGAGAIPALPARAPRYDDEQLGVSFFRMRLADAELAGLTLPRTFFGRSEVRNASFRSTDLSESTANWNDFIDVDFSGADLSRADLRASVFERVSFRGAALRGADLRRATFHKCVFTGADMTGAKVTRALAWLLRLSRDQRRTVDWQPDPGPEPEGG
jgi:uncharacterized protein YjbI with pentapeptide repeats